MAQIEVIDLTDDTKEINDFLERVLVAGEVQVKLHGELFSVQVTRLSASKKGRDFLAKGRPILD